MTRLFILLDFVFLLVAYLLDDDKTREAVYFTGLCLSSIVIFVGFAIIENIKGLVLHMTVNFNQEPVKEPWDTTSKDQQ